MHVEDFARISIAQPLDFPGSTAEPVVAFVEAITAEEGHEVFLNRAETIVDEGYLVAERISCLRFHRRRTDIRSFPTHRRHHFRSSMSKEGFAPEKISHRCGSLLTRLRSKGESSAHSSRSIDRVDAGAHGVRRGRGGGVGGTRGFRD